MTTVLLRYLDDLAPERAPAHERLSHLWDRVNHPRVLLQEADVILRDLDRQLTGRNRNTAHPVPVHVAGAALALGTGHDLLKTHYNPRSDWANAIEDMSVRHAVLDIVARQAQLLGRVMKAARAEVRRAGLDSVRLDRLVTALQTAGDIAFRVTAPGATETLAAVPLRATQPPSALPATASVEQLCAGIITNAEGIRTAQPEAGGQLSSADSPAQRHRRRRGPPLRLPGGHDADPTAHRTASRPRTACPPRTPPIGGRSSPCARPLASRTAPLAAAPVRPAASRPRGSP